ncbi:SGNH/GDSL hydrolase family protein [Sharpea azabuensis]|uniref:GDSL-like Lipase/Acylhydrolase family n=1 Tax=Sharpea azabuensis TaxID=322505 RepID=A0A1H6U264_9FIRM|nr:SGNH/GDSL hydrolase family protein [Sharpea azabuensis]SEI86373.1 GDSL-like Lipase/Acylhydrolase family [Sharpea azabuensis]SFE23734.1 GDSL-like Lipase/Acylhydrolase family [Sharpea azabuensis]SFL08830.1 GDSL-like Lipase/Acylhydrolase family [Sharpea azabuensis]HCJ37276.1 SGNH/GDSL hydrolase family protein [Erysipelotrichaceae bacterium]
MNPSTIVKLAIIPLLAFSSTNSVPQFVKASTSIATEVKAINTKTEINAWGDSMTEGVNGDGVSYPSVLAKLTGMKTNNYGVGGETSEEIMNRSLKKGDQSNDILIIEMGDNGGWDKDIDTLINQYKTIIANAHTDRYIIISSTDDPNDSDQIWGYTDEAIGLEDTWYEEALEEAFGEHLLKGRQYLIKRGLAINGIPFDEEDIERAHQGLISEKLRHVEKDNTHLNSLGYTAQAYGVYELGQKLGYWK